MSPTAIKDIPCIFKDTNSIATEIFYNAANIPGQPIRFYETLLVIPTIKWEYLKLSEQNFFNDEVFYDLSSKNIINHVIEKSLNQDKKLRLMVCRVILGKYYEKTDMNLRGVCDYNLGYMNKKAYNSCWV